MDSVKNLEFKLEFNQKFDNRFFSTLGFFFQKFFEVVWITAERDLNWFITQLSTAIICIS